MSVNVANLGIPQGAPMPKTDKNGFASIASVHAAAVLRNYKLQPRLGEPPGRRLRGARCLARRPAQWYALHAAAPPPAQTTARSPA